MEKGWDECARICMTHSYLRMQDEFTHEPEDEKEKVIKAYIMHCQTDDYDRLIQLCDSVAVDYGFVILEKRFKRMLPERIRDHGRLYQGMDVAFEIKEAL